MFGSPRTVRRRSSTSYFQKAGGENGKDAQHWLSLGTYPDIGIARARELAHEQRSLRGQKLDPKVEQQRGADAIKVADELANTKFGEQPTLGFCHVLVRFKCLVALAISLMRSKSGQFDRRNAWASLFAVRPV